MCVLVLLAQIAKTLDAVLISHPSLEHLGGLPYLVSKLGLNCPIIATLPVHDLGQMFMYDAVLSRSQREEFTTLTLDDLDAAFDDKRWVLLKYRQRYSLSEKGHGITITPHIAGHTVGGTVWLITKEVKLTHIHTEKRFFRSWYLFCVSLLFSVT
jgi:cleavage and polyadenylation specificity factor subunit 2